MTTKFQMNHLITKFQMNHLIAMAEYEAWRTLVRQLEAIGATTRADGEARAHDTPITPGQQLYASIRRYAFRYADLCAAEPSVRRNEHD